MVLSGVRVPGSATAGARMLVELLLKERTRYSSRKGSVSTCSCPGLFSCRLFFFFFLVRDKGLKPTNHKKGTFTSKKFIKFLFNYYILIEIISLIIVFYIDRNVRFFV